MILQLFRTHLHYNYRPPPLNPSHCLIFVSCLFWCANEEYFCYVMLYITLTVADIFIVSEHVQILYSRLHNLNVNNKFMLQECAAATV